MEKMNVFAKQKMKFDTKEGNHVEGIKCHCTKKAPNDNWDGVGYEGIFVSIKSDLYKTACELPVGSSIEVSFNRYGKPDSFSVCK